MLRKKLSKYALAILILSLSAAAARAQAVSDPQPLVSGTPIEHELASGESQTYQIKLVAGQFVHFGLEQRVINAAIILIAPDNKQQVEMDLSGAGGEETLSFEVITAGVYKLLVKGSGGTGQHGSYRLETIVKEAVSEADKKRLKAESLMIETAALTKQGAKTTQQVIDKTAQALSLWQEIGEPYWAAACLYRIGSANLDVSA